MGRRVGKILIVLGMIFLMNSVRLKAEEIPKPYQVKYEQPDGRNEYYSKAPEIQIEHFDEFMVTKYKMRFADGKELTGKLDKTEKKAIIQDVLLVEGENCLEVWMENEKEEIIEGTETKKVFKIDSTKPEQPLEFIYQKENEEELLCFPSETSIQLKASDSLSGIAGIYYQMNDEEEQFLEGESVRISIPIGFEGTVTAYAVDNAGNQGEKCFSKTLICENEQPEISIEAPQGFSHWYNEPFTVEMVVQETGVQSGIKNIVCHLNGELVKKEDYELKTEEDSFSVLVHEQGMLVVETEDYAGNKSEEKVQLLFDDRIPQIELYEVENHMITSTPVSVSCVAQDEHRITSVSGKIVWKNPQGEEVTIELENWKKDGEQYHVIEQLEESGIYQLYFAAEDQAGNTSENKTQIIIDRDNPVISKVEQFQGAQLPCFEWNYSSDEVICDFTTYTYIVSLDNCICEPDFKYIQEGKHILEVTAKDAAGNLSKATAEFMIDHTEPEIIFKDVEEGKTYEREVEVSVLTKNDEDIIEKIYVDGMNQELDRTCSVFRYLFQEPGGHTLKVVAKDRAGNQREEEIQFEVVEKTSILEKMIRKANVRQETIKSEKKETVKEEKKGDLKIIGIVVLVGSIAIALGMILRRKVKKVP